MVEKQKILVVDDIPSNIKTLHSLLRHDYRVLVANNGVDAIKIASSENSPDLILLDIMMPGMDGYEVCRRLKADPVTEGIPILFVSAKNEVVDEVKGFDLGAVDYITKPLVPVILLARVKTHLNLVKANKALVEQNAILQDNVELREDIDRMMRHDLKSPLTVVVNYPEMILEEGGLSEDHAHFIEEVKRAGYRLLNMVNHSLDLYKMEKGIYSLKPDDVDLVTIFNQIKAEFLSDLNKKRIQYELSAESLEEEGRYVVSSEELLLFSLFSNLIKNSIEASEPGAPITVSMNRLDSYIQVAVSNKGEVPLDVREKFFDKYVTSGKEDGTGLGTYSAKLISETVGGKIELDCSVESATTIKVLLPLER